MVNKKVVETVEEVVENDEVANQERNSVSVLSEIFNHVAQIEADAVKWTGKKTKSAGANIRKATSALEKLGKEFRKLSIAESKK